MSVWTNLGVIPFVTAKDFKGTVGDYLICVHINRSAGPALNRVHDKIIMPLTFDNLISCLNNAFQSFTTNCLEGIEANEERLKKYVERSVGIITAVNPHLGYEVVSRIAREAILTGKSVRELCLQYDVLTEEELDLILNPFEMTNPGIAGSALFDRM